MKFLKIFLLFAVNLFAADELVVGTATMYAPYVSLNEKGEYEGFDIDVAQCLAQKLGRKLVIKDFGTMPSLIMALKQKKADVLMWAISITEEREKAMEMVYYQGEKVTEMPFIFWKNIPGGINSVDDLANKSVCVEAGTFQEAVLKKRNLNIKYLDKITDALMDIKFGKSLTAPVDPSLLPRIKAQFLEIKILNLPLPPQEQSLGNGICIDKGNPALTAQVRQAIDELTKEGKMAELEKKWKLKE